MRLNVLPAGWRVGVVAAIAAVFMLTAASSAHAWAEGKMQDVATHRCLRDDFASGLTMGACDTSLYPQWIASLYSNGWVRYQNAYTGRCLDDSSQGLRSMPCISNGSSIRRFQSWTNYRLTTNQAIIAGWKNMDTGRCLEDSFDLSRPKTFACMGPANQHIANQRWRWSYHANG